MGSEEVVRAAALARPRHAGGGRSHVHVTQVTHDAPRPYTLSQIPLRLTDTQHAYSYGFGGPVQVRSIQVSGDRLLTGCHDGRVRAWDMTSGNMTVSDAAEDCTRQ